MDLTHLVRTTSVSNLRWHLTDLPTVLSDRAVYLQTSRNLPQSEGYFTLPDYLSPSLLINNSCVITSMVHRKFRNGT